MNPTAASDSSLLWQQIHELTSELATARAERNDAQQNLADLARKCRNPRWLREQLALVDSVPAA